MELWFLIIAAMIIAWVLFRAAGGGCEPMRAVSGAPEPGLELREELPPWMARDPVCSAVGPVKAAAASLEHEQWRFYFCSQRCRELFAEDPQHYAAAVDHPEQDRRAAVRSGSWRGQYVNGRLHHLTLDWRTVGLALGSFFAITFVLCVLFGLLFPQWSMYELWSPLLPGFTWLSWRSFLLGLVESIVYGFYIALLFCPLYNVFSRLLWRRTAGMSGAGEGDSTPHRHYGHGGRTSMPRLHGRRTGPRPPSTAVDRTQNRSG
jgi:YHS domain-containing protein